MKWLKPYLSGRLALNACLLLVLGSSLTSAAPNGADWPGWRGAHHDGIAADEGLNWKWPPQGPAVRWRAAVGVGFSSFAVAKGHVFTMGNRDGIDTVYCLDVRDGRVVWKHSYPAPLDPLSYEGGPSSTPTVDTGRVYTLSKAGDCFCLDVASGQVIWSRKFAPPPTTRDDYKVWWGFAGSPLIQDNRVILPVGTAGVALDKATGTTIWDNGPGRPGYSSPVPFVRGAEPCFCLLSGHEIIAARVGDGKILWRIPWRTTWDQNASDVIVAGGKLFVSTGHGVGCALFDITTEKPVQLWRNRNMKSNLASPVLWRNHLYGFNGTRLCCLDWVTGALKWSAEDTRQGSLIVADGRLVVLDEKGALLVAEASGTAYHPLARAQVLTGRCWSMPVLAGGLIFVRNAAGTVVCLSVQNRPE